MNRISSISIAAVLSSFVLVIAACSSDDEKATASSGGTATIAQAQCAQESKCDPTDFSLLYASTDDCVSVFQSSVGSAFALNGVTITNGQLSTCADAITASSCDNDEVPACEFTGSLAVGAGCLTSIQCTTGYCKSASTTSTVSGDGSSTSSTTTVQCGTCADRADVGGACEGDDGCKAGLGCDQSKKTCAARPAKGAACTAGGVSCASGTKCINAVCADPVQSGGACDDTQDQCANNLFCINGKCGSASDQFAVAAVGQPCGADTTTNKYTECKQSSCVGAQGAQKCVAWATEGQACSNGSVSTSGQTAPGCKPGLECNNNVCAKPVLPTCK